MDKLVKGKARKSSFLGESSSLKWISLIGFSTILAMLYSFYLGQNMVANHAPLIDATMEIKLEATFAHMRFAELIDGNRTLEIDKIWRHLDQSEWYANAMLVGGENSEGKFIPLKDTNLRREIELTIEKIDAFRTISKKRWTAQSDSQIVSKIDRQIDQNFYELLASADKVETELQRAMQSQLSRFQIIQIGLLLVIIFITIVVGSIILRNEKKIKHSLQEKETLLQEIHHRVKNNIQVISSLLGLKASTIDNEEIKTVLVDSQNRVKAMGAVHENLYRSTNLSSIEVSSFLKGIADNVVSSCQTNSNYIGIEVNSSKVFLPIEQATSLGLIINELVSNSLKHAFPDGQSGKIRIDIDEMENQVIFLRYSDDGVGLSSSNQSQNQSAFGLNLVSNLVEKQLDGSLTRETNNGTIFEITFEQA